MRIWVDVMVFSSSHPIPTHRPIPPVEWVELVVRLLFLLLVLNRIKIVMCPDNKHEPTRRATGRPATLLPPRHPRHPRHPCRLRSSIPRPDHPVSCGGGDGRFNPL